MTDKGTGWKNAAACLACSVLPSLCFAGPIEDIFNACISLTPEKAANFDAHFGEFGFEPIAAANLSEQDLLDLSYLRWLSFGAPLAETENTDDRYRSALNDGRQKATLFSSFQHTSARADTSLFAFYQSGQPNISCIGFGPYEQGKDWIDTLLADGTISANRFGVFKDGLLIGSDSAYVDSDQIDSVREIQANIALLDVASIQDILGQRPTRNVLVEVSLSVPMQ